MSLSADRAIVRTTAFLASFLLCFFLTSSSAQAIICPDVVCPTVNIGECPIVVDPCGCDVCASPTPSPVTDVIEANGWFRQDQNSLGKRVDVYINTGSTPLSSCLPNSDWYNVDVNDSSTGLASAVYLGKMFAFSVSENQTVEPIFCGAEPPEQVPPTLDGTIFRFASKASNMGTLRDTRNQFASRGFFPRQISFSIPEKADAGNSMELFPACQTTSDCSSTFPKERCYQPPNNVPKVCIVRSDLNFDGSANLVDYTILANSLFSTSPNSISDLNNDGYVDILDYSLTF